MIVNQEMKFQVEPALRFRGRTRHENKPKKELKRNGQKSKPNKPRHFADRNENHFFNLLVCLFSFR